MDGERLLNNLLRLKGRELRIIYAFLAKTSLPHLLSTLSKTILSKDDCTYLTSKVASVSASLDKRSDTDIQLDLFQELCQLIGRHDMYIQNISQLRKQCEEIVLETHKQLVKQDKLFAAFIKKMPSESRLEHLVHYQLERLMDEMDLYLKEEPKNRQATIYALLYSGLQSLSTDQQDNLKNSLQINDVTPESLMPIFVDKGLKESIEILRRIAGPKIYEAIPSILFFLTKKQTQSSGNRTEVANPLPDFLLSPLLINPFILKGRALLVNYHHKSIKKRLLPYFLFQITFLSYAESEEVEEEDRLIHLWMSRSTAYKDLHYHSNLLEMQHIETSDSLNKAENKLTEIENRMNQEKKLILEEKEKIKGALTYIDIRALKISDAFTRLSEQYENSQRTIRDIESLKRSDRLETSVMKQVSTKLMNMTASLDILSEKRRSDYLLSLMVEEVITSENDFKDAEKANIKRSTATIDRLAEMKRTVFMEKERCRAKLSRIENQQEGVMKKLQTLEKTNKGLKEWLTVGEKQ